MRCRQYPTCLGLTHLQETGVYRGRPPNVLPCRRPAGGAAPGAWCLWHREQRARERRALGIDLKLQNSNQKLRACLTSVAWLPVPLQARTQLRRFLATFSSRGRGERCAQCLCRADLADRSASK